MSGCSYFSVDDENVCPNEGKAGLPWGKYRNFRTPRRLGLEGLMRIEQSETFPLPKFVTTHVVFHISMDERMEEAEEFRLVLFRLLFINERSSFGVAYGLYHAVLM